MQRAILVDQRERASVGAQLYGGGLDHLAQCVDDVAYRVGRLTKGWGAATLVAGPSGSGKTLMGLHFIISGARRGEPGIIATLQENPTQLARVAEGFGWSLEGDGIELLYRSPVDLYVDQWVYELLATIERTTARRVVIDSLGDLAFATGDEARYREYLYSLAQRCSRLGVSLLMTFELPDLFQLVRLSEAGVSHLSDNVVVLQYLRHQPQVKRALTILKTRASLSQPQVREFTITPAGITLGGEVADDSGVPHR